jgi:hypothetical protein
MLQGKDVLLLAGSNEEAAQLASRVQTGLIRVGLVQAPCTPLADGNQAGTGDHLRARLNCAIEAGGRRLTNQITGLIDPLRLGDQEQATCQRAGGGRDVALMFLKPGKTTPVLRTDPCDQLRIHAHAHALSQTTDKLRP